jgi:shikimate dehydrogenase
MVSASWRFSFLRVRHGMTARYAIIGDPIEHSLSPVLHNAAFAALGIDATYERLQVRAADLAQTWSDRLRTAFDGFNVTMPHKAAVLPMLDHVDELAKMVGAVNTVIRRGGRLEGMNTDVVGIRRALAPFAPSLRGRPAVIIGAGATARSAVAALATESVPSRLTFLVRDPVRAASHMDLSEKVLPCPAEVFRLESSEAARKLSEAALILQTTPVGMAPNVGHSALHIPHRFAPSQTLFDVIYRPLETALMASARRDGANVISGLELFLHQGAAAFEAWTGRPMPLDLVRPTILKALAA